MSSTTKDSIDVAAVQEDIVALKRELADLVQHVKHTANQAGRGAVAQLSDEAERLYRNVSAEGRRRVATVSHRVEEQPLTSVLVAFGIGLVVSRILLR